MKYLVSLLMVLSTLFVEAQDHIEKYLSESEISSLVQSVNYFIYNGADAKTLELHRIVGERVVHLFDNYLNEALVSDEFLYIPECRRVRIGVLATISMMTLPDSVSSLAQLRDEAIGLCLAWSFTGSVNYNGSVYTDPDILVDAVLHESENVEVLRVVLAMLVDRYLKLSPDVPMYGIINKLSNDSKFQFFVKNKLPALLESSKKN